MIVYFYFCGLILVLVYCHALCALVHMTVCVAGNRKMLECCDTWSNLIQHYASRSAIVLANRHN